MADDYNPQKLAGTLQSMKPRDESDLLDDLGNCASGTRAKSWVSLEIRKGGHRRAFQFVHLGVCELEADGTSFTLTFNVPEKWAVHVQGRNLVKLFTHIHHHKIEWISQAERDFAGDGDVIITKIDVVEVKSEPVRLEA